MTEEKGNCSQCTTPADVLFATEDSKEYGACARHVVSALDEMTDEYGQGNYVAVTVVNKGGGVMQEQLTPEESYLVSDVIYVIAEETGVSYDRAKEVCLAAMTALAVEGRPSP